MVNLTVAHWDSSAYPPNCNTIQKHPPPLHPLLTPPTKPQLSMPTPPGQPPGRQRTRGQSRKNKTHQECTNTQTWRPPRPSTLFHCYSYKMFGARLWSPGPAQTTEFLIFLCVPPSTTSAPLLLWSRWECFVKTQHRRARPVVHYIKHGGYKAGWPPAGPWGPHQHRPVLRPRGGTGMLFQSSPVHSDGWENIFLHSVSVMDEFCFQI